MNDQGAARPAHERRTTAGAARRRPPPPLLFPPDMALPSVLHTSLSLALLASGADAPAPRPLTDLMPSEAMAVIEVGDLGAALATPVEERGDWLRLLMDERFTAPLIELAELGDDEELVRGIGAVLADVRGGAAAYDALDGGLVLAALDVDEGFGPALEAILQGLLDIAEGSTVRFRSDRDGPLLKPQGIAIPAGPSMD